MAAVSVEHLSKSYGDTVAVRDVSFEVQKGEVFALLGPNGAGKTTTVEILEGFRDRSGGAVQTLGVDPADHSTQRWLRTRIGVVLQELAIEPYYSVRQVLTRNAGYYPNPRPIDEVIELIGLREKADERIKKLSGGQQRRLDVGLGIIGNPDLLFLDEPTTGLDPAGRRDTWDLIKRLSAAGTTVLLTTHYMDEVEALAQRVAVLFGQEIVASGTPSSIGGRDLGAVTIRFRLPEGVALGELPMAAEPAGDGQVVIHTEDELRVLHELTGWALAGGHALGGAVGAARVAGGHLPRTDEVGRMSARVGSDAGALEVPEKGSFRGLSDLPLVARQVWFEQLSFWLNPIGALMTIAFSVIFLILLGATAGTSTVSAYGHIKLIDYYVAGFCAYGVMAACFTILAISLVNRREMGLLKRLRLSPLPTWMAMSAVLHQRHDRRRARRHSAAGGRPPRLRRPRAGALAALHRHARRGDALLQRPGGRGQHTGTQRRLGGSDREPDLLHPRRAVRSLVPHRAELGAGHVRRLLPHPPPDRCAGGFVHRSTGDATVALARPRCHGHLGRRGCLRRVAPLDLVAQAGLNRSTASATSSRSPSARQPVSISRSARRRRRGHGP